MDSVHGAAWLGVTRVFAIWPAKLQRKLHFGLSPRGHRVHDDEASGQGVGSSIVSWQA